MTQIINDKKVLSVIRRILKKRISHGDKIILLNSLRNNKTPNIQYLIDGFIRSENFLIRKKGLNAADAIESLYRYIPEQAWLLEYQAYLYSRYAYHHIASGAIQKAHSIYTQRLNWKDPDAWRRIADILKKHKGWGFAAQCYANAGKPDVAARMLKRNKKLQQAGWYFEQAESWKDAALCYRKDKLYDKAGECFAKQGDLKTALRCWKKAGSLERHNIGKETWKKVMSKK